MLNGTVSGAYGFEKEGAGALTLNGVGTFTGGVTVNGGTLRLNGANTYGGATGVTQGALVLGGNAPSGADSSLLTFPGRTPSVALVANGNYTVDRGITFAAGTYEKRLAATNATVAAWAR